MIIAVDFDGTLCKSEFPEIGEPNTELIEYLKELREGGHSLILWTCRENILFGPKFLDQAVNWCRQQGLEFDAVNKNLQSHNGFAKRKVLADVYIDDKAVICRKNDVVKDLKRYMGLEDVDD